MPTTEHAITKIFKLDDPEAKGAHFQHLVDLLAESLDLNDPSKTNLLNLLEFFTKDAEAWTDGRHAAYALATAYHETGYPKDGQLVRFAPVTEYGTKPYFNKYEPTTVIGKRLGNTELGDGFKFRGRGFVQITGRSNYAKFSEITHRDLIEDPDKALEPAVAYLILREGMKRGLFTGKRLADYIHDDVCEFVNARKVINGLDRAHLIARAARQIDQVLHS
jgi:putative chitinase